MLCSSKQVAVLATMLLASSCAGSPDGRAVVDAGDTLDADLDAHPSFDLGPACAEKRIKIIYTAPEVLQLGQLTRIEAQVFGTLDAGRFDITWYIENDETHGAKGRLFTAMECKVDSHACVDFACTRTGEIAVGDGGSKQFSGLYVVARYRDDVCFDTARVALKCASPVSL